MNYSPKECLERANIQVKLNTMISDRYACLELRQCIEALAYSKLKAYKDRIPSSLLSKWQPGQAIKILSELEPDSKKNSKTTICSEKNDNSERKHVVTFEQKEITASVYK